MRILLYKWGSHSERALCDSFERTKTEYDVCEFKSSNFHADSEFANIFLNKLHSQNYDAVISFDYFPMVSMMCEINKIPYYSWIYDCPMHSVLSLTSGNNCNHLMCFDRNQTRLLNSYGLKNAVHFPLWANPSMRRTIDSSANAKKSRFACDVSFVGNFYNGPTNRLRSAMADKKLTSYSQGFIEALLNIQGMIPEVNILKDSLIPDVCKEVKDLCELSLDEKYIQDDLQMVSDTIGMELSAREREKTIEFLAHYYPLNLYTSSDLNIDHGKLINRGRADNATELPLIYSMSRINLNITSTTITSGIPLRVLDILSCGGFCLTNYRSEIAEYFSDGEDLVIYYNLADLKEKIDYYLSHEEERKRIASSGYQKAIAEFNIDDRLNEMFTY